MIEKIKKYKNTQAAKSLGDVRTLSMIAFGIIALLVTWSSVKVVETNYGLQKQMSTLRQQNEVRQLANNNLKLQNEYYKTDTYLELAARRHFNKASPGETLVIVPKDVALAHSIDVPRPKSATDILNDATKDSGSKLQNNFNSWLDFLFHRRG
jgi:cell division protein FtsB